MAFQFARLPSPVLHGPEEGGLRFLMLTASARRGTYSQKTVIVVSACRKVERLPISLLRAFLGLG